MSLINESQRKKAQQQQPVAKPIKVAQAAPELEANTVDVGEGFPEPTQELPTVPEPAQEQPTVGQVPSAVESLNITPESDANAPQFKPQLPGLTQGINIWEPLAPDLRPSDPKVLQSSKPTVYDSSVVNSNATRLDALGSAGLRSAFDKYNREQQQAIAQEQEIRERANDRAANVNIPRKDNPWYHVPGQWASDILFGSKQTQEEAERNGVVNPFKLQYGKQGAGVGGWVKYVLSTPWNATVGLAADINQAAVSALQAAGVSEEQARRFAKGGVIGFALDNTIGKKATDSLAKRFGLQQDWSRTQGRSAAFDAITRGESAGDLNDPKGNNKGVFYREQRQRRTPENTATGFLGTGGIGQAITDDPFGAAYEILGQVLDPAGNAIGDILSSGIRNLARAPKPKPPKATGVQTPAVFYPPTKPQRALPPGKVKAVPVEQQLEQLFGNQIPPLPRKPGEARLPPAPEQQLPMLPGTPPPGGFQMPRVNLGSGIPVTGTRVIQPDAGALPPLAGGAGATRKTPNSFVVFPNDANEVAEAAAKADPWNAAADSPLQMRATLDGTVDLSRPQLPPGRYRAEAFGDAWLDDFSDIIDANFEPLNTGATTQTKAPRIYEGDFRVVQKALPPAIDASEVIPEAIIGTPSEVVFRVGIGTPSAEPLQFADEIVINGIDDTIVDEPSVIDSRSRQQILDAEEQEKLELFSKQEDESLPDTTPEEEKRLRLLSAAYMADQTTDEFLAANPDFFEPKKIQSGVVLENKRSATASLYELKTKLVTAEGEVKYLSELGELSDAQRKNLEYHREQANEIRKKIDDFERSEVNDSPEFANESKELDELLKRDNNGDSLTEAELARTRLLIEAQAAGETVANYKPVAKSSANTSSPAADAAPSRIDEDGQPVYDLRDLGVQSSSDMDDWFADTPASKPKPTPQEQPQVQEFTAKGKREIWKTGDGQPLKLEWQKHKLASGKVRYISVQELDKLWKQDRVDTGGVGGIGNRYKEAQDFINKQPEPIIMSEVVARADGSIVFKDGRHRFAVLRDMGFTEIPVVISGKKLDDVVFTRAKGAANTPKPPTLEQLEEAQTQLASHKAVVQAPLQQLEEVFDSTVDFGRKQTDELPFSELTNDQVLDAFENSAQLNLPKQVLAILGKRYGDDVAEALADGDYFVLASLLPSKSIELEAFVNDVAEINNGIVRGSQPPKTPKPPEPLESPKETTEDADPYAGKTSADFNDYKGLPDVVLDDKGYYNPPQLTNINWGKGKRINPQKFELPGLSGSAKFQVLDIADEYEANLRKAMESGEAVAPVQLDTFDYGSNPMFIKTNGNNGKPWMGLSTPRAMGEITALKRMGFTDVPAKFNLLRPGADLSIIASRGSDVYKGETPEVTKFTRKLKPKTAKEIATAKRNEQLAKETSEQTRLLSIFENSDELGYGLEPDELERLKLLEKAEEFGGTVEEYLAQKGKRKSKAASAKPTPTPTTTASAKTEALANTVAMPPKMSHGTALANWTPFYNTRLNGSRGELGSGLYLTNRRSVATDYAQAIISENVSPGANAKDIAPAVYDLTTAFTSTFSARGKLAPSHPIVKALVASLPEQMQEAVRKSIARDSSVNYVGLLNKVEAALVRSGLATDESTLKDISSRLSETLRTLGYDSVYDTKSGFGLVLDDSKIEVAKSSPISKASSPTQAALARYNADAYAAKFYNERLTTDANLRDSAYKLLSQIENTVDNKLAEVQQEIIKRGLDKQESVLPPKQSFVEGNSRNNSKPQTMKEVLEKEPPKSTDPCNI